MKLLIFLSVTLFSYIGWELGAFFGFGWAFFLSSVASLAGVWIGWKIGRHFGL